MKRIAIIILSILFLQSCPGSSSNFQIIEAYFSPQKTEYKVGDKIEFYANIEESSDSAIIRFTEFLDFGENMINYEARNIYEKFDLEILTGGELVHHEDKKKW